MSKIEEHPNWELEYDKALSYVFHMYDTRHKVFHYTILMNSILFAVTFQYIGDILAKIIISTFACIVSISLFLMAIRSWKYLCNLESSVEALEAKLGFSTVTKCASNMPKGIDSTKYLFLIYFIICLFWVLILIGYFSVAAGLNVPMP